VKKNQVPYGETCEHEKMTGKGIHMVTVFYDLDPSQYDQWINGCYHWIISRTVPQITSYTGDHAAVGSPHLLDQPFQGVFTLAGASVPATPFW